MLIHGFPDFWYSWRKQIPMFSTEYKLIIPDLRGYNESEKPDGVESYSMSMLVQDMIMLVKTETNEKVVVIGHDWGGSIAWNMTMRVPNLIEKLVVLNSPHPIPFLQKIWEIDINQYRNSWYVLLFQLQNIPQLVLEKNNFKFLVDILNMSSSKTGSFTEEDIRNYLTSWSKKGATEAMVNFYKANWDFHKFLSMNDDQRKSLVKRFPKIQVPTMVLWGVDDDALDVNFNEKIDQYVNSELILHRIEDAGHWVHLDQSNKVNKYLEEFLK